MRMRVKNSLFVMALVVVCISTCRVAGFTASGPLSASRLSRHRRRHATGIQLPKNYNNDHLVVLWLSPEEQRAAVLSEYLAKAHEEKLKAIRAAEAKKDEEIKMLKEKLAEKSQVVVTEVPVAAPAPAPAESATISEPIFDSNVESLSKDELLKIVKSYRAFMTDYIAKAHEQKTKAVKAAEEAMAKKYEARLQELAKSSPGVPTPPPPATKPADETPPPQAPVEPPVIAEASTPMESVQPSELYVNRNARVVAAASAGKSRWGSMEIERANTGKSVISYSGTSYSGIEKTPVEVVNGATAAAKLPGEVPPEVIEADHGLRNDGGVGGLTLAERVALGSSAGSTAVVGQVEEKPELAVPSDAPPASLSSSPSPSSKKNEKLFQMRNAKVAAAAKVGKSRWGPMEIEKIKISGLPYSETEVEAADHGLRADGGVTGPSLSDRVNLGAKLLNKE